MCACLISILWIICFVSVRPNSIYAQSISSVDSSSQNRQAKELAVKIPDEKSSQSSNDGICEYRANSLSPPAPNTFENLNYWAELEENMFKFANARHIKLKEGIRTLKKYIKQYRARSQRNEQHFKFKSWKYSSERTKFHSSNVPKQHLLMLHLLHKSTNNICLDTNSISLYCKKSPQEYVKHETEYSRIDVEFKTLDLPNLNDLELSMNALIHNQLVYTLEYKNLPAILSPETRKPPLLNAFHCSQIGMHALFLEYYAEAIEWTEYALEKFTQDQDNSISLNILESNLEFAVEMHNEKFAAVTSSKSQVLANLYKDPVSPTQHHSQRRKGSSTSQFRANGNLEQAQQAAESNFNAICSGKDFRTVQERSALYSWYDKSSSPANTILPYKKELLSLEPEVVRVYDIIGEKLMSSLVKSKQNCYMIARKISSGSVSEEMRRNILNDCWSQLPDLKILLKKAASLTLTDCRSVESYGPYHLNTYIFGRMNHVHLDTLPVIQTDESHQFYDSLKSLLFYFNDVPAGGSTAFPSTGTAAAPIKGSVVYWQNMYRNGSRRIDTWHGACPVIYGIKQVVVMGIHSYDQFRTYPCTINPNE